MLVAWVIARWRFSDRVFPSRWTTFQHLRDAGIDLLLRYPHYVLAVVWMCVLPTALNARWATLAAVAFGTIFACASDLVLEALARTGLLAPAPERVQALVPRVLPEARAPRGVHIVPMASTNAITFVNARRIVVTARLLDVLDDDEVTAVCARMGESLREPPHVALLRRVPLSAILMGFVLLPTVYVHAGPTTAWLLFMVADVLWIMDYRGNVQRQMRSLADLESTRSDSANYARALAKLYEDVLAPVVTVRATNLDPQPLLIASLPPA